jgi:putative flippase GtrA
MIAECWLMTPREGLLEKDRPLASGARPAPQVDIVVPVRDEERDLGPSVRRIEAYLSTRFPFSARITIADNGSSDGTWAVALALASELDAVRAVRLEQPGRGRALRSIWLANDADVLAYMDVDLSTDLNALLPLVAPLFSGHSDMAIGTRLARGARVIRGPRREVISRGYNLLLHAVLGARFSDAQCGFKAISTARARVLLPLTRDTGWFFDTELLVLAQQAGLRIHEVPVDWIDDSDSRVKVIATILADLRGIARLGVGLLRGSITVPFLGDLAPPAKGRPGLPGQDTAPRSGAGHNVAGQNVAGQNVAGHSVAGQNVAVQHGRGQGRGRCGLGRQLAGFAAVGAASTVAYILLYLALRGALPAQWANALSLLITAVANTAANRRFTFGIRGRPQAGRHQARGLLAFGAGLLLTSAALAWLHAMTARPGRGLEVAVLAGASLLATLIRFALYRNWVFRGDPRGSHR